MTAKDRVELRIQRNNGKIVMYLDGYLDGGGANKVVHTLQSIHGDFQGRTVVLDLSAIKRLEYFGIATLSQFIRNHGRQFRGIKLDGLDTSAQSIFKRFGVET